MTHVDIFSECDRYYVIDMHTYIQIPVEKFDHQKLCKTRESCRHVFSAILYGRLRYKHGFDAIPDPDKHSYNLRIGLIRSLHSLPEDNREIIPQFKDDIPIFRYIFQNFRIRFQELIVKNLFVLLCVYFAYFVLRICQ